MINKVSLILCNHPLAKESFYPDLTLDALIECDECGVSYRIRTRVISLFFKTGKLDNNQRDALLRKIKSEFPKLQKDDLPLPEPVVVDSKFINDIIGRTRSDGG